MFEVETRKRQLDDTYDHRGNKRPALQPLLKLLIPNDAAGALIGNGGGLIKMQNKFGGTIRVSADTECYPGTDERIVIVCGEIHQLLDYNNHIMKRLANEYVEKRPGEKRADKFIMVLTTKSVGLLVGQRGYTIKAIEKMTGTKIKVVESETVPRESILTMSGGMDQRKAGCKMVIELTANERTNKANLVLQYGSGMNKNSSGNHGIGGVQNQSALSNNQLSGFQGANNMNNLRNLGVGGHQNQSAFPNNPMSGFQGANNMNSLGNLGMGGHQNQSALPNKPMSEFQGVNNNMNNFGNLEKGGDLNQTSVIKLKTHVQIQIEVPEVLVDSIMGKEGQLMCELNRYTGATIGLSPCDSFAPGTINSILTITGDINETNTAYDLITQRVQQVVNELSVQRR